MQKCQRKKTEPYKLFMLAVVAAVGGVLGIAVQHGYTQACAPFATLTVSGTGGIESTPNTSITQQYQITASGTYTWGPDQTPTITDESGTADAEYADTSGFSGNPNGWNNPSSGLDVLMNNTDIAWQGNGVPDPAHTYTYTLIGTGNPITFNITDADFSDNAGSIAVSVEECPLPPPPPSNDTCPDIACKADLNCSGEIETTDFTLLMFYWGDPTAVTNWNKDVDFDGDGSVDLDELGIILSNWRKPAVIAACQSETPPIVGSASALSYPRTSGWFFGQTDIPEWLAQYDLVYTNKLSTAVAQDVKSIDPDILMIASVYDWNTYSNQADRLPREWLVRDHTGADVCAYGSGSGCTRLIDISMHAPQIQVGSCSNDGGDICADNSDCSGGATCQGISGPAIRYNEFIADRTINAVDLSVWDGVATHGVWDRPRENPVDLDRNGQNDWDEHGSTTSWLRSNWLPGVEFTVNRIRSAIGPDKILHLNSGRFHNPGSSGTGNDVPWTGSNGLSMEEESGFTSFRFFKNAWDDFRGVANLPYTIMLDSQPSSRDPFKPADDRNYYRFMRGMLTTSLYGDGFFSFTDLADKGTHHYELYFDEYNTDLGQPTGLMQLVRSTGADDEGVYVRFFDNGAAIANISRSPQEVSDTDISSVPGYSGPYHRFQGGQNPSFNNGSQFTSVSLEGGEFCVNDACGNKRIVGDGIILLKNPTTVVADIIIDNIRQYTSPGTNPVSVVGSWTDECGTDHWSIRCAPWRDEHDFKSSSNGGDEAVFTPQIGVAADYDIYEWHGQVNSGSACTAVQLDIQDATCSSIASTIDQSTNIGQWNHIGTCSFSVGNIGKVSITNPGGCTTIVDAFKFKLAQPDGGTPGPGGSGDTQAPVVTSFSVTSGSTIVDWQVSDTGGSGLKDLNILRYAGTCSEAASANWSGSNLFTDTISISAVSPGPANHAGTQVQNPPTGTYCYGLRIHDHDGNVGSEQVSIEFNAVADAGAGIIDGTRLVDWTHAGYPGSIQCSTSLVDVTTMGIVGDGVTDNAATMQALINDPANADTFYFPPGTYRFETKLLFDQNTKFRGAGSDQTHLEFALAGDSLPVGTEAIRAVGGEYGAFVNITGLTTKGTTQLQVADTSSFAGKEFVEIQQTNDPTVMGTQRPSNWDEPWAANSQGQIIKIQSINGNTITLDAPLAVDFKAAQNPQARGANLMKGIAIEDLHIKLVDPGADYATILLRGVADSWIRGVESELTSKYHIWVQRSSNIEIRGNYIHDSYSHDGGHGYGVLLNSHTSNVLVEDNIFRFLRHAMIVKEGANTNVIGYNYSIHPHFGDGIDNSSIIPNDLSLHGHYPYMNLFEGNIFNQGGVGDYWGPAGPGNTFVRNKVEPMPSPPFPSYISHAHLSIEDPSHDQNVVGNEMPHNDILELDVGAGLPQGTLKHGNIIQGNVQWDTAIAELAVPHSYYYTQGAPTFLNGYAWPPFGPINEAGDTNNSSIPAQDRYSGTGNKTVSSGCSFPIVAASGSRDDIQAAVDIASPGETVAIPAGTFNFSGQVTVPSGINIVGAGREQTELVKVNSNTDPMFRFDCSTNRPFEFAHITLRGIDTNSSPLLEDIGISIGQLDMTNGNPEKCDNFRIHDSEFISFGRAGVSVWGTDRGLIDNNIFTNFYRTTVSGLSTGYGVEVYGNNDWPTLALGGANAIFVEDNTFTGLRHTIASNAGSQYVFRHNTIEENYADSSAIDAHGKGWAPTGSRSYEIYENTLTHNDLYNSGMYIRGGDGVIFGNTINGDVRHSIFLWNDNGGDSCTYPCEFQTRDLYMWDNMYNGTLIQGTRDTNGSFDGDPTTSPKTVSVRDATVLQPPRDYHDDNTQRPGYAPYTYPHPLRSMARQGTSKIAMTLQEGTVLGEVQKRPLSSLLMSPIFIFGLGITGLTALLFWIIRED